MVKAQVRIPDRLYKQAKRVARENEMSFADVVRRGLERVVGELPRRPASRSAWRPPRPRDLGVPLVPESDWTTLAHD